MLILGAYNKHTGGRCGACEQMGCIPTPPSINQRILAVQKQYLSPKIELIKAYNSRTMHDIYSHIKLKVDRVLIKLFT